MCIICPEHGEFWQKPHHHLRGSICPKCSSTYQYTTEEWIKKAKEKHGDKYDYSKVSYVNATTKVCIRCPEHGEFWQTPRDHLSGRGCPSCAKNHRITQEEWVEKARGKHGDKYDYSKVVYKRSHDFVTIICPKHGEFQQIAKEHLKYGCKRCADELVGKRSSKDTEYFIKKSTITHGGYYDYSKVNYKNTDTPVCIICPEHGEFWQAPHFHIQGHGCVICGTRKHISEQKCFENIVKMFPNEKIVREKTFPWLKDKHKLRIDIFIEKYNIGIEYQGGQHFQKVEYFGGDVSYNETIRKDKLKRELCENNGVRLLYFSFDKETIPNNFKEYNVITDIKTLETEIKKIIINE